MSDLKHKAFCDELVLRMKEKPRWKYSAIETDYFRVSFHLDVTNNPKRPIGYMSRIQIREEEMDEIADLMAELMQRHGLAFELFRTDKKTELTYRQKEL